MRCQFCGFMVANEHSAYCPNCGSTLMRPTSDSGAPDASSMPPPPTPAPGGSQEGWGATGHEAPQQPAPGYGPGYGSGYGWPASPSVPLGAPPPPPYGQPGAPSMPLGAPPPGYTPPPGMPPGMPPTMPYGPPAYGQPAPPSVPYGQPPNYPYGAPPSMPMGAPYPGYPPVAPMGAPPPPRKGRVGLIIGGSIAAVLVFCVVAGGVLYAIGANQPTTTPGALATATTAAQVSPTATPEEIALYQNAFTTVSDDWANDTNCFFGPGGYHIKGGYICYAPVGDQANVDVTVDVQQVSGPNNDVYGLALRLDRTAHTDYDLNVDALGHWVFYRCSGSTCDRLIDFTAAASLHAGLNVTNKLQAKVKGSHFDFFINGVKVGQFEDSTYTSGLVGLECGESSECVFANLSIAQPR